ncbi:Rad17p [Sporobolomyces koalae]|uniref:Rad17p n=1 Tax=Sporobolomyces koalae TaxID=500713 RepID=UPI00316FD3D2
MADVRPLASLLKSLSFKSRATLKIDEIGLRMIVEEGRSIQAHAFMSKTCFKTYNFDLPRDSPSAYFDQTPPPDAHDVDSESPTPHSQDPNDEQTPRGPPHCEMTISLATMLECLNIFGNAGVTSSNPFKKEFGSDEAGDGGDGGRRRGWRGDGADEDIEGRGGARGKRGSRESGGEEKQTSLRLSYAGIGEPLIMLLEESGIVTRCELTTYEPEGLLDLRFIDEDRVQRLIMKSEWLSDALHELPPTSDKLSISFSPAPEVMYDEDRRDEDQTPLFRLEATGAIGSTEMDYSDNRDILEVFECESPIRNSYKFSHIQLTRYALANSIKTSIRTDDYGLVSFQFMIPLSPTKQPRSRPAGGGTTDNVAFVEFLCVALDE